MNKAKYIEVMNEILLYESKLKMMTHPKALIFIECESPITTQPVWPRPAVTW